MVLSGGQRKFLSLKKHSLLELSFENALTIRIIIIHSNYVKLFFFIHVRFKCKKKICKAIV